VPEPTRQPVRLVVVTGSGRSGTSTVAGTLKRLGLHVPQPEIPADETNPRGFYEPEWVVAFHKRLLNAIPVRTNDARPTAAEQVKEVSGGPEVREELRDWLAEQVAEVGPGGQLVVKDPRAFWAHQLWSAAAAELGVELSFLTMLRHPAEVAQSRDTHYLSKQTDYFRRQRQTANIAGWVNAAFETELATRGHKRTVVRYTDLMADWRDAMIRVADQLDISYNADLSTRDHHDVDDFIDPKLHRQRVLWDDVDTSAELLDIAESSWQALNTLVDAPDDADAIALLEQLHPRYAALHEYAEAIVLDHSNARVELERRRVRANLSKAHERELRDLRRKLGRGRRKLKQFRSEATNDTNKGRSRGPGKLPWSRRSSD
jgi:hypothetical protein